MLFNGFKHSLIVKREFLVSYKGMASYSFRVFLENSQGLNRDFRRFRRVLSHSYFGYNTDLHIELYLITGVETQEDQVKYAK